MLARTGGTMNQIEVLQMIMHGKNDLGEVPLSDLIAMLADRVAAISGKLSDDELYPLVSIGAALYQCRALADDEGLRSDMG
jgi:hypothetical protein